MDQAWLVPVAIAFGFVLGAGSAAAIVAAHRRGQRAVAVITPTVPEGADEVIDSLESAGIVLDASNNVLKASTGALAFGLVWNQALVHPELVELVDRVRRRGQPIAQELHLSQFLLEHLAHFDVLSFHGQRRTSRTQATLPAAG